MSLTGSAALGSQVHTDVQLLVGLGAGLSSALLNTSHITTCTGGSGREHCR
jgi:hypothetical protein